MNPKLEQNLLDRFPAILRQRGLTVHESCMAWGFTLGDGWYPIVEALLETAQAHCDVSGITVEMAQAKEKLGGMRVYWDGSDRYIHGVTTMVCEMASRICELTGQRGRLTTRGGFLQTLSQSKAAKEGAVAPKRQLVRQIGKGATSEPVPEINWESMTAHDLADRYHAILHGVIIVPNGLLDLVHAMLAAIMTDNDPPVVVTCINWCDGVLHVAYTGENDDIEGVIQCAKAIAQRINPQTGALNVPMVEA